ncbi:hypothetical protein DES38_102126 [Streptohalobacillus salinus]|uniref:Flagellar hook-length control protein FliK n=1 Tax=Streptohalobacillus salinus TaxID=621096 RepID=A0A2V3WEG8_9BACI|nr:hypothetical protein [Streptohalobacillus salinus]PXW92545.1 hypothetical protein DES38_102126 [Streptohalobacillus salinus]
MPSVFNQLQSKVHTQSMSKSEHGLSLKEGQLIQGKIVKLHPEQLATIQMGGKQVTAKMEAPAERDQSFIFEVTSSGDVPKLRIVQEQPLHESSKALEGLLKQLGVPSNKDTQAILQRILRESIPVQPSQLSEAVQLMSVAPSGEKSDAIVTILKNGWPLTNTLVDTLLTDSGQTEKVADGLIKQLVSQGEIKSNQSLINRLNQLVAMHASEQTPEMTALNQKSTDDIQLLKGLQQMIEQKSGAPVQDGTRLVEETKQLLRQQLGLTEKQQLSLERFLNSSEQPLKKADVVNFFRTATQQSTRVFETLPAEGKQLINQLAQGNDQRFEQLQAILKPFQQQINAQEVAPSNRQMQQLAQLLQQDSVLMQKISHQLSATRQTAFEQFVATPSQATFAQVQPDLSAISAAQLSQHEQSLVSHVMKNMQWVDQLAVKDQFLLQLKDTLLNTGLDYEFQLMQKHQSEVQPLKQLLLDLLTTQSGKFPQAEELVQIISKQQLTMVNQNEHFIHYSMEVPVHLENQEEVRLDFYGQKNQDEAIDPNYCRIAFYLQLSGLGDTVIDMTVQNRHVQLTVVNDHDLTGLLAPLKTSLKEGLQALDYQLGSVRYKPYQHYEKTMEKQPLNATFEQKGWDFKA